MNNINKRPRNVGKSRSQFILIPQYQSPAHPAPVPSLSHCSTTFHAWLLTSHLCPSVLICGKNAFPSSLNPMNKRVDGLQNEIQG